MGEDRSAAMKLLAECERRLPNFPPGYDGNTLLAGEGSPFSALHRHGLLSVAREHNNGDLDVTGLVTVNDLAARVDMETAAARPVSVREEIRAGSSARVALRPVEPRHTGPLYAAAMSASSGYRWRFRGRYVPPQHFEAALSAGVLSQFAVEGPASGDLLGIVVAYDHAADAGHASVGFQRVDGPTGGQEMYEAIILFLGFCFSTHGLERVFFEVPEYNDWLVIAEDFITLEATIADFFYFDGRRWAKKVYSLSASRYWEAIAEYDQSDTAVS